LAIYLMLLVSDPDTIEAKPTALYAQLVALARQLAQEAAQKRQKRPQPGQSPGNPHQYDRSPVFRGSGSQLVQMAGLTGQRSKHTPTWRRIRELHVQRFGPGSKHAS
jgi:hypothetical protein